jgi:hypothetical protein
MTDADTTQTLPEEAATAVDSKAARDEARREKARKRAATYRAAKRAANPPAPKPAPYDPQRLYEIHHRYYLKNRERFCDYAREARTRAKATIQPAGTLVDC